MRVTVEPQQRYAKMRAHTATHLLHFALDELLNGTKQAGSLVDEDYLRFDFATKEPLTAQQIHQISSKINHWIKHGLPVTTEEMAYDKAIDTGAKAFFEDKYDDTVRVVSISDRDVELKSIELCGGTHVENTSHIGAFNVVSQESVASGIRRIVAVTGPKVAEHTKHLQNQLITVSKILECQPKQLEEKATKITDDYKTLQSKYDNLQKTLIKSEVAKSFTGKGETFRMGKKKTPVFVLNMSETSLKKVDFKTVVTQTKQLMDMHSWIIFNDQGNFAVHAADGAFSAKDFLKAHQLRGGGSDQLVQGKDKKIKQIIDTA